MATAPTVTFTSVAGVCTHLRNGARRLLRKVPELELAAQNGHRALFASMIEDNELGGDAYKAKASKRRCMACIASSM